MTEPEQAILDWAVIGGGIVDIPLSDAGDTALLALISAGFLTVSASQPNEGSIRYELTEQSGFHTGSRGALSKPT